MMRQHRLSKLQFRSFLIAMLLCGTISATMLQCSSAKDKDNTSFNTDANSILIIFYDTAIGDKPVVKASKKYGSQIIYQYKTLKGLAVTVPKGKTKAEAIKFYEQVEGVLSVNEDQVHQLH